MRNPGCPSCGAVDRRHAEDCWENILTGGQRFPDGDAEVVKMLTDEDWMVAPDYQPPKDTAGQ